MSAPDAAAATAPAAGSSSPPAQAPPPADVPAGFDRWRQSLASFTGLGLSDAERAARAQQDEQGKLASDWDRCEKWKAELMTRSECARALPTLTLCQAR